MRLRYAAQAREHIAAIYSYIRDRNPVAATLFNKYPFTS